MPAACTTPKKLRGTTVIPSSKPHCQRAVLLGSLAEGRSTLRSFDDCTETSIIVRTCTEFGASYRIDDRDVEVQGMAGGLRPARQIVRTAGSGFALRTLLAASCLAPSATVFVGDGRMAHRPIAPLIDALSRLGGRFEALNPAEILPLVSFGGGIDGGLVEVTGDQTSQFVTSLLLVAPFARQPLTIRVTGPLVGSHYVLMTIAMMRDFGAEVEVSDDLGEIRVSPGGYQARTVNIGPDVNAFFYFVASAVVADADIEVENVTLGSDPLLDAAVTVGRRLGVRIEQAGDAVRIVSGPPPTGRVHIDAVDIPTLVPALAAVASNLPAGMELTGAHHLVHHKTSRLDVLLGELASLGRVLHPIHDQNALVGFVTGEVTAPERALVDSHGDHRLFMALYLAGLGVSEPVAVTGQDALTASFPRFLETFERLAANAAREMSYR